MKPAGTRLLICVIGFATIAGLLPAALVVSGAAAAQEENGKAERAFTTVCSKCHPIERVTTMRRTRSQWEEAMTSMITSRGAQISDEDFETILNFLVKEYGRIDVNRAPAPDIVEVLDIPEAMAAAIVAYRREHGRFEDFDALMKVPGIDRQKLEPKRDAIMFSPQ